MASHLAGRWDEASAAYERLYAEHAEDFQLNHLFGGLRFQQGRHEEALALLEHADLLHPNFGPTLGCLAVVLAALGRRAEAEQAFGRSLDAAPTAEETWVNFGMFLMASGRVDDALAALNRAVEFKPDYATGWMALGRALQAAGRGVDAVIAHTRALEIQPGFAQALHGRAHALQSCHCVEEALADCDAALAVEPDNLVVWSSRLFLLNFREGDTARLAAEHAEFGRAAAKAARRLQDGGTSKREVTGPLQRRLRLALLSPDLRTHSVASFLMPLLRHLDRERFEIFLYHDHFCVDATSERFRALADRWTHTVGWSDDALARTLASDGVDLLVDLAGHTGFNRMPLLAGRVAPVQIAYLGYPNTTGLDTMDFRLTDGIADPEGDADRWHTERLVRFAPSAWAYDPPDAAADPESEERTGPLVFGSFNALSKLSEATLQMWSELLRQVPGSKLRLKSAGLVPSRWEGRLARAGIERSRVELRPACRDTAEHLAAYREIDVALDPFPYNGTTTTCEALWMGVPVVTLAGNRHCARVGASLLHAIGRPEWVAKDPMDYLRIAGELAQGARLRKGARGALREAMRGSALCDHAAQTRRFEAALLHCWREREETGLRAGQFFPDAGAAAPVRFSAEPVSV